MSSVVKVLNPLSGILCVPYYHLWIVILISWILNILEMLFIHWLDKQDKHLWSRVDHKKRQIYEEERELIEIELEDLSYDQHTKHHSRLPLERKPLPINLNI